ncbi:MAG: FAD-dependent oxidoreductase [Leucobacter sp.]
MSTNTGTAAGAVVIIGAGMAGYTAATQLRKLGHEDAITLVDAEPATYDRPPLSKNLFEEDFRIEKLAFATAEDLQTMHIETRFGAQVMQIDPAAGEVVLADGDTLRADTVIIAMGGSARELPIPGADLPGVTTLRTFDDALELRNSVTAGTRVAVVGAGLIGAELASALRLHGAEVTLIDPMEIPLLPAVGELLATHLHAMHEPRGIRVVTGLTSEFAESDGGLVVKVQDGPEITVDRIVVGVGLVPNVELAEAAGLDVDNGILVDETHRTSAPNVYAIGDVARTRDSAGTLHRREEHWEAAQLSGVEVAYAVLGQEIPARGASWFWSDRHDCHLEATGRLSGPGVVVVRNAGDHPAVFLVEGGLLQGAASVNDTQTVRAARRLIDQRIPVAEGELADPNVSLRSLLKQKR